MQKDLATFPQKNLPEHFVNFRKRPLEAKMLPVDLFAKCESFRGNGVFEMHLPDLFANAYTVFATF